MRYSFKNILGEFRLWVCNHIINKIPSHSLRIAFYKYVMGFKIGAGSSVHLGCKFNVARHFTLGTNSTINQNCHLDNRGGIVIGNNVSISPFVAMVTADHEMNSPHFEGRVGKISIEDFAFIGYGALILKNILIRQGGVISARSVLTKDTDAFSIYAGIPAKKIGERNRELAYSASYKRLFW